MNWALAISRNREALLRLVGALFWAVRLQPGMPLPWLPRATFSAVMLVLRPAESAARRLILLAALTLTLKVRAKRDGRRTEGARPLSRDCLLSRAPAFGLFDPLKRFDPETVWGLDPGMRGCNIFGDDGGWPDGHMPAPAALAGGICPATHVGRRLNALLRALETLPRQARRLARWQLRRDAALSARRPVRLSPVRPVRLSPMRPGLPPGWRQRKLHEVDDVLRECHGLAHDFLNAPDSG